MVRLNFSGHPVDGCVFAPWVGASLPLSVRELEAEIRRVMLILPGRAALLRGAEAELVLPGHSVIAALLLAEWHGQFGSWPTIRWRDDRRDKGMAPPQLLDLNLLRHRARQTRNLEG
jgi:hypothetical protein